MDICWTDSPPWANWSRLHTICKN